MPTNKMFLLKSRPVGRCSQDNFTIKSEEATKPAAGEVLLETLALSVDPTNRIWMSDMPGYMPPVGIGEVMRSLGVGRVLQSNDPSFAEGDIATGLLGWQTHPTLPASSLSKVPPLGGHSPTLALGPLGMTGLTAYFGLDRIGKPKKGETVVVSAAAGAVGSIAGQIAKKAGARVVGLAGSAEKCNWLTSEAGFDAAFNYKDGNLAKHFDETCPNGIDVYFENVGGTILEHVLQRLNIGARIPLCGLISQYNATEEQRGPRGFEQLLMKRARLEGFIILDFMNEFPEGISFLANMLQAGELKFQETLKKGFETMPDVVNVLFDGGNSGKLVVQVADELPKI